MRCGATALFAMLAGCVDRETHAGEVVVTFAWWVKVAATIAAPVLFVIGLRLRSPKWRLVCCGVSVIGSALALPSIWSDAVRVSRSGLHTSTGLWFAPRVVDVVFAEAKAVWLPRPQPLQRRRTAIRFRLASGGFVSIPQGDLMTQCLEDVGDAARSAGLVVVRVD